MQFDPVEFAVLRNLSVAFEKSFHCEHCENPFPLGVGKIFPRGLQTHDIPFCALLYLESFLDSNFACTNESDMETSKLLEQYLKIVYFYV